MINRFRKLGVVGAALLFTVRGAFACDSLELELPGKVAISVYAPNRFLHNVLIMPPTGGENFLDRGLAEDLCRRGVRAIVLQSWPNDHEPLTVLDLGRHDRLSERAVQAMKTVIDWTGSDRVGIVGASLGGMYASYLLSVDPRVVSAVFVVAGGPISEVIAYGDQDHLNELRKARRKAFGFRNNQEYANALEGVIYWDTVKLAQTRMRDRVSFIIAQNDETVPTPTQWKLYQAWGAPSGLLTFRCNHVLGIFRAYQFNRDWIARQLLSRF